MVNGAAEQRTSSKESSPIPSPTSDRKAKTALPAQSAATLPARTQETPSAQMEGFLNRKHEWEAHNKKASSRYSQPRQKLEAGSQPILGWGRVLTRSFLGFAFFLGLALESEKDCLFTENEELSADGNSEKGPTSSS